MSNKKKLKTAHIEEEVIQVSEDECEEETVVPVPNVTDMTTYRNNNVDNNAVQTVDNNTVHTVDNNAVQTVDNNTVHTVSYLQNAEDDFLKIAFLVREEFKKLRRDLEELERRYQEEKQQREIAEEKLKAIKELVYMGT